MLPPLVLARVLARVPERAPERSPARLLAVLAAVVALGGPSALSAQACLGNPSFALNHLQVGAGAMGDPNTTTFGANFVGGSESVFAGLGVGGANFEGFQGSSLLATGTAGFQVPLSSGSAQVCPIVSAQFGFGPNNYNGLGADFSSRAISFGIAAGGELFKTARLAIVPSVSLGFAYTAGISDGVLARVTATDTYAVAGAALGVVVSDKLSVRPSVSFPIGLDGAEPIFGIGFALNYGGRR